MYDNKYILETVHYNTYGDRYDTILLLSKTFLKPIIFKNKSQRCFYWLLYDSKNINNKKEQQIH